MDYSEEREQTRFIKRTHRPDIRLLVPELCGMFCWLSGGRHDAPTSGLVCALNSKLYVPALLMLAHGNHDTGLTLEFESANGTTIGSKDEWLRHLRDEEWVVLVVVTAEEARMAVMRYLDKEFSPL